MKKDIKIKSLHKISHKVQFIIIIILRQLRKKNKKFSKKNKFVQFYKNTK